MDLFTPIEDDENYVALCNQLGDKNHAYHSIKMSRFEPFSMWQIGQESKQDILISRQLLFPKLVILLGRY